jgi:hypothetical protein
MEATRNNRRGFLRRALTIVGGLAAVPALAQPALAGRSHWRRGWGRGFGGWGPGFGGRGYGRWPSSHRRFYGGYPRYGPGFGGYGGGFYGRGFYGAPYAPYSAPITPYYSRGYIGPIMKLETSKPLDALALLEC